MKTWKILQKYNPDSNIIEVLLQNRGLSDPQSQKEFIIGKPLAEYLKELDSEFKNSLLSSRKLILEAINNNQLIIIYGDYDADGVCATAILYNTLKKELKYENVSYFIPNRFDNGYGLSVGAVDSILQNLSGQKVLFVTVDTGITATKEIEYIKSLGHSIIITDHHQKLLETSKADVTLWSDKIVGSTISFILSRVLGSKNTDNLAYAALATVTDLHPLFELNRALVIEGLKILNNNPPLGLKKLLDISAKKDPKVTVYDMGWVIGPKLNASGRVLDATASLKLLIENDSQIVEKIAKEISDVNSQRQDKTLEMYDIANLFDEKNLPKVIVSANEKYHEGIIGLVAGRLVQKYYRPTIVIAQGEELSKGSVRSVEGVDIISFLRQFPEVFVNLGGHPMAAGFTIKTENLDLLKNKVIEYSASIDDKLLVPTLTVDLEMPITLVTTEFVQTVATLEPYGVGNKEPLFVSRNIGIAGINNVGKDAQHVSFKLFRDGAYFKAILFNGSAQASGLNLGDKVDIVYSVSINEFNGISSPNIVIKDMEVSNV